LERDAAKELVRWKDEHDRKPLLLGGVRRCGKTWLMRDFGKKHFENCVYVNFESDGRVKGLFEDAKNPTGAIAKLAAAGNQQIVPGKTLVIFDEIQECPNALEYFREDCPQIHVICAGALPDIRGKGSVSFPVGEVRFLDVFPMTFSEYLDASGQGMLRRYIESLDSITPVPETLFRQLEDALKFYFVHGGMPEPVRIWTESADPQAVQRSMESILDCWQADFPRRLSPAMSQRASRILQSLPAGLSKDNARFRYSDVYPYASIREYSGTVEWLAGAKMVHRVCRCKSPLLPEQASENEFKLYAADVGLLRLMLQISMYASLEWDRLFTTYRGALTENYIVSALAARRFPRVMYWSTSNPPYEVDFLIRQEDRVIPVEVKAGRRIAERSLSVYRDRYPDSTALLIRFSAMNLDLADGVLNIPFFLADRTPELIGIALDTPGNSSARRR